MLPSARTSCTLIIAAYTFFSTAELAPAAQAERRPLDCAGAIANVRIALANHLEHDRITKALAQKTAMTFLDALLKSKNLLTAETQARLHDDRLRVSLDADRIAASLQRGDCSYFDDRARPFMKQVLASYRRQMPRRQSGLERLRQELRQGSASLLLRSFMSSLDPHSKYNDYDETAFFARQLLDSSYSGVGILLQRLTAFGPLVLKVLSGGPAQRSGAIKAGDLIVAIDGVPTAGVSLDRIHKRLVGFEGSRVRLDVAAFDGRRVLARKVVTLERVKINQSAGAVAVSRRWVDGKWVATLKLERFYAGCFEDARAALAKAIGEGEVNALVLDLRGNGGGMVEEARRLAGFFIGQGPVYGVERRHRVETVVDADPGKYEGPLIVAVDVRTASSSEIVAGALKDYRRALIVGDKETYGKGTTQRMLTENDGVVGGSLLVTTGRFYTPSGHSPQFKAVASDVVVPSRLASAGAKVPASDLIQRSSLATSAPVTRLVAKEELIAANADPDLLSLAPVLQANSTARGLSDEVDPQLREIERVAADYAQLRQARVTVQ